MPVLPVVRIVFLLCRHLQSKCYSVLYNCTVHSIFVFVSTDHGTIKTVVCTQHKLPLLTMISFPQIYWMPHNSGKFMWMQTTGIGGAKRMLGTVMGFFMDKFDFHSNHVTKCFSLFWLGLQLTLQWHCGIFIFNIDKAVQLPLFGMSFVKFCTI